MGGVTGDEGKGDFSPGYCIADPGFFKGQTGFAFCKGRGGGRGAVTIHCLINKLCELGACFLYISYVLAQNGG